MIINATAGRSNGGRYSKPLSIEYELDDIAPSPHSLVWADLFKTTCQKLVDLIDKPAYTEWWEGTWPQHSIEEYSWKDVYKMALAALVAANLGERKITTLVSASWGAVEGSACFQEKLSI